MSSIQHQSELRYMKRGNLHEESLVIGNYYRDLIRSFGIDCVYLKLDTSVFENFSGIVDLNVILQHAYGINTYPDYSCSALMITYPEIDQDIFQLQKYGLNPLTDINFYFDSVDFACDLAEKCGQYKEYKIKETFITCEVPACTDEIRWNTNPETGEKISSYVSADLFPYKLGLGYAENYECELMTGKLSVSIDGYVLNKDTTTVCDPFEHNDFKIEFPVNDSLHKSLTHKMLNSDYLQTLVFLTYKVSKVTVANDDGTLDSKYILHGKIHGGVLFYDIYKLGKYLDLIHPEVGDLITIDYPDSKNPEKYEITDCFDKSLLNDGISPLLHNYIWKCKARRYVNNYDDVEMNEADKRLQEKKDFEQVVDAKIVKLITGYPDKEDAAYGGYDGQLADYDSTKPDPSRFLKFDFIDDGTALDLLRFGCGSRLVTTGYELVFINIEGIATKITTESHKLLVKDCVYEEGLKWLKASADTLVFLNAEGEIYKIVEDIEATTDKLQMCLNSLFEMTVDQNGDRNKRGQSFYMFKESRTILWATETELFCRLASNGKLYKIA